jgi:hypothetical protein
MFNRVNSLRLLLALFGLALAAVAALAQGESPAAPDAVRVRVVHLAPFAPAGEDSAVRVEVNGDPLATNLSYGEHEDYQTLAAGPGNHQIEVLFDGGVIVSKAVTLSDGDYSLAVIGDLNLIPGDVLVLHENAAPPPAGRSVLRVVHVAPIGATLDETRVDVCTQDGIPFDNSANNLRYRGFSSFKSIPAATYDLKVTRADVAAPCTGQTIIDPPPMDFPSGVITNLYLIGDDTNRPLGVFTFATDPPPPTPTPVVTPTPVITPPPSDYASFIPAILK